MLDYRPICGVEGKYRDSLRKPTHEILYRTSRVCVCLRCCFSNLVSWLRLVTDSTSEENKKSARQSENRFAVRLGQLFLGTATGRRRDFDNFIARLDGNDRACVSLPSQLTSLLFFSRRTFTFKRSLRVFSHLALMTSPIISA